MKRILYILLLLPALLLAQADSWVNFAVQYDYYAPQESNFTFVSNANGDTILYHQPTSSYEYLDTTIFCNSGDYLITLNDSYGDGWLSNSPAYFKLQNSCQGMIINFDPLTQQFFTLDTLVNINPCAPPLLGCTDSNADNYNINATQDDGSCVYPPCSDIIWSNAYQNCQPGGQALSIFEWETDATNANCDVTGVMISNEEGLGPFTYMGYWNAGGPHNFAVNTGPGQMPPNWEVEYYCQLIFADGSVSDTITYTPTPCIEGCIDPTQISYNPWATIDDGSCAGTTCDINTEYQITMEIMLDNWPGETGWTMVTNAGPNVETTSGTYDYNDIGQTYTYDFCVSQGAGFELILTDTYGDGMAGSTSGGSMDGTCIIYDCAGDTLWYMDNPGFGNVVYSGGIIANPCPTIPVIDGCTDDDYVEFNPAANNDDGSCLTLHTYGCVDSAAFNYDSTATMMDFIPDCQYELWIGDAGGDGWGNSYIGVYQNGIDLGTYTMGPGSYEQTFNIILDPAIPVEVYYFEIGGLQTPPEEIQFQTWHNSFKLTNADSIVLMHEGINPFANNGQGALQSFDSPFWTKYTSVPFCGNTCIEAIIGCMDSTAFNYNELANTPDTCIPVVLGCTNTIAFNYDSTANVDDGSCVPEVIGCMDADAFNYNPAANTNDSTSCIPVIYGCMDDTMFNYNAAANTDDGTCIPIIYGCIDPNAYNYDSNANTSNNSCVAIVYGCTDPTMYNYDPTANTDDSTCIPIVYGCMDATMYNYDATANVDNGSCEPFVYGCTDSTMFNFNPLANADNNSCIPYIYGCTDPSMLNYDPLANTEDFSCISYIYGCTDSTALNYDPLANTDNGSCIETVEGCTDVGAYNYDPVANVSDPDACLYDAGCIGDPGEPYWLNDECYAWVISVDDYCCDVEWDETCQLTYEYCGTTWTGPEPPSRIGLNEIIIYPNPTSGVVNIGGDNVDIKVYNHLGKLIIDESNATKIDLSNYANGMYHLHITKNEKTIIKKIIKNILN